jgi:type VI secretion system protein ImpM
MPSVDAIGRSFPLTVGCALVRGADPLAVAVTSGSWFDAAEELAAETLSDAFEITKLERPLPPFDPFPSVQALSATIPVASDTSIGLWRDMPMLSAVGAAVRELAGAWQSPCLWWTKGNTRFAPGLAATPKLIPSQGFAALFDGDWARHGWAVLTSTMPQPAPGDDDDAWDREV